MLDAALAQQLRQHLTSLRQPIELVATLDDSAKSGELGGLLDEIAGLSDLVSVRRDGTNGRVPSSAGVVAHAAADSTRWFGSPQLAELRS